MGIQGLSGLLENTDRISQPFKKEIVQNINKYKYIYFDFQAFIYTVFNFVETIINYQLNIVNEITILGNTDIDKCKLCCAILHKLKEHLKTTSFGGLLYKYETTKFKHINGQFVLTRVQEDLTEFDLNHSDSAYKQKDKLDRITNALQNFVKNKNNYIKLIIIDNVKSILDKFPQLTDCIIVFDGKPFFAKMIEQVKRRTTNSILNVIKNEIKDKLIASNILKNLPEEIFFDRSIINSKSSLMVELIRDFRELQYVNSLGKKLNLTVIDNEPGEGEHIINRHIINKVSTLPDTNDDKFLYYSPDGDVALLTMIINIKIKEINPRKNNNVDLIKLDSIDFNNYKFSYNIGKDNSLFKLYNDDSIDIDTKIPLITKLFEQLRLELYFVNILKFQRKLLEDINEKAGGESKSILKKTNMLKQYIALFSIFGNDFMPKLLSKSIGEIFNIISIYNDYLLEDNKAAFIDYLNNPRSNDSSHFKFLVNLHDYVNRGGRIVPRTAGKTLNNEKDLNINVLNDILKSLINYSPAQNNEEQLIIKQLNKESGKSSKNITEYIDAFNNISTLFCMNDSVKPYKFLTSLLDGNYYINLSNIAFSDEETHRYYQELIEKMIILANNKNKTEEEKLQLQEYETEYYVNILYYTCNDYLNYYNNETLPNPVKLNKSQIKVTPPKPKNKSAPLRFFNRVVPFNEIIHFNPTANADECVNKYIQGFQYVSDLYFTLNVTNKSWGYQCENPPTIVSLINYLNTPGNTVNALNYNGPYDGETQFNLINHQLTKDSNMKYLINLRPAKYYLIDEIFACENVRYTNKCSVNGDTTILPFDNSGRFINIIGPEYNISPSNTKLNDTLTIARSLVPPPSSQGGYREKYLKYKTKYLKLKKQFY